MIWKKLTQADYLTKLTNIAVKTLVDDIHEQRAQLIEAFIAQHGCNPDEAVQIIQHTKTGMKYWIEKRAPVPEIDCEITMEVNNE